MGAIDEKSQRWKISGYCPFKATGMSPSVSTQVGRFDIIYKEVCDVVLFHHL
jgi:hypothetical protein